MLPSAHDLVYFNALANELHISQAAKKLNISQPTLSLAVQRLEQLLETTLCIRHKLGVTLTPAGELLAENTKSLLQQWEQIVTAIKNPDQQVIGQVRIGCHSTLAPFMSEMVSKLLQQYPHLQLHFQHDLTPQIIEKIVRGQIEIGITTDPYQHPELIIQQIAETEFSLWKSASVQEEIDLLAEDTLFICDPQLAPTHYLLAQLEAMRQHKPLRLITMNQIESIAAMTASSKGVGILPNKFTEYYFAQRLEKIASAPVYKKPMCLAYRPQMKKQLSVRIVLDEIRALVV